MLEIPSGEPTPTPVPPSLLDIPFRAIGALIAYRFITDWTQTEELVIGDVVETRFIIALVVGVTVLGWVLAPFVSSRPAWAILSQVRSNGPSQLVAGAFGFLVGVAAGAIIASTLPPFEEGLGRWLPTAVTLGFGAMIAWVLSASPAAGGVIWTGVEHALRRVARRPVTLKKTPPAVPRPTIERRTDQAA